MRELKYGKAQKQSYEPANEVVKPIALWEVVILIILIVLCLSSLAGLALMVVSARPG